jgi:protein-disulfide isomerase
MEGFIMATENKKGISESKKGVNKDSITVSKTTLWQAVSGILAVLLALSIYTGGLGLIDSGTGTGSAKTIAAPTQPSAPPTQAAGGEVTLDDAFSIGSDDAPVTMVEFTDYQCPFCGRFYSQTLDQIKTEYVDTGKVKLYIKDFPLDSIHPQARPAANAARCAAEQGNFWDFHDKLFDNQGSLSESNYKIWAGEIGVDQAQFDSCLDSKKYDELVTADLNEGTAAGIRGTPGFIVDGQLVSGAQPFAAFQQIIEASLSS